MTQDMVMARDTMAEQVVRAVNARLFALRSMARELGITPSHELLRQPAPAMVGIRKMSVLQALEWAFAAEHAYLDFDGDMMADGYGGAVSTVWVIMQRGNLGCRVDGGGRSRPATDAEIIAAAVAGLPVEHGGRVMAAQIADLARAGLVPDWMPDAAPRVVPEAWRETKHGRFAKTEVVGTIRYRHRGRLTTRDVICCPVRISPSFDQIAAARQNYLDWYGALLHLQCALRPSLDRIQITDDLPALAPWRKAG